MKEERDGRAVESHTDCSSETRGTIDRSEEREKTKREGERNLGEILVILYQKSKIQGDLENEGVNLERRKRKEERMKRKERRKEREERDGEGHSWKKNLERKERRENRRTTSASLRITVCQCV